MSAHKNGLRVVEPKQPPEVNQELKCFLHVLYRALRMICAYLEKTYGF